MQAGADYWNMFWERLQKLNTSILFRHQWSTVFCGPKSAYHWPSQNFSAATSCSDWLDLKIVPLAWIILCSQWTSTELLLAVPSRHQLVERTVLWRIKDNGEDTQAINHYEGRTYYECRGRGGNLSYIYWKHNIRSLFKLIFTVAQVTK